MKYIKKRKFVLLIVFIFIASIATTTFAHSGRTDSNGGHKDNKNVSGLGSYHYHCGGYPAHLHINGKCPYRSNAEVSIPKIEAKEEKVIEKPTLENEVEVVEENIVEVSSSTLEKEEIEIEAVNNEETTEGSLGTLILLGGAGYLGYKKFKN